MRAKPLIFIALACFVPMSDSSFATGHGSHLPGGSSRERGMHQAIAEYDALRPLLSSPAQHINLNSIASGPTQRIYLGENNEIFKKYGGPNDNGRNGIGQSASKDILAVIDMFRTVKDTDSGRAAVARGILKIAANLNRLCSEQRRRFRTPEGEAVTAFDIILHYFALDDLQSLFSGDVDVQISPQCFGLAERSDLVKQFEMSDFSKRPEGAYQRGNLRDDSKHERENELLRGGGQSTAHRLEGGVCNQDQPYHQPVSKSCEGNVVNILSVATKYDEPTGAAIPRTPKNRHLIVPEGIDHAVFELLESEGMGYHIVTDQTYIEPPKPLRDGRTFRSELRPDAIFLLATSSSPKIPLLVSKGVVFRAVGICLAEDDECVSNLRDPFLEADKKEVLILPKLSLQALETVSKKNLGKGQKWVVQYQQLSDPKHLPDAEKTKKALHDEIQHVVHPGESPHLAAFTAELRKVYKKSEKQPSLAEFVDTFGLANCSLAAIRHSEVSKKGGQNPLFIVSGSTPGKTKKGTPFIDFQGFNHAWNMSHAGKDPHSYVSLDITPFSLTHHLKKPAEDYFAPKFTDIEIEKAALKSVLYSIQSIIQTQMNKKLPTLLKEGDPTKIANTIPDAVRFILKDHFAEMESTARFLIQNIGDEIQNEERLLKVLETHPQPELKDLEAALRGRVFLKTASRRTLAALKEDFTGKPISAETDGQDELFRHATRKGNLDLLHFMVHVIGFDINRAGAILLLESNREETIKELMKLGVKTNYRDEFGNTLTHLAVLNDNRPLLETLKDLGVGLNVKNNDGDTPLAIAKKNLESMKQEYPDHSPVVIEREKLLDILSGN